MSSASTSPSQPVAARHGSGDPLAPSGAWRPSVGFRQNDPAGFVRLVQDNPGFWAYDYPLKYLKITIDTREPAAFWIADRDGNAIEPQRVLDAIERWKPSEMNPRGAS